MTRLNELRQQRAVLVQAAESASGYVTDDGSASAKESEARGELNEWDNNHGEELRLREELALAQRRNPRTGSERDPERAAAIRFLLAQRRV